MAYALAYALLCFDCQMIVCFLICKETINEMSALVFPSKASLTLVRFICGVMFHVACQREFN